MFVEIGAKLIKMALRADGILGRIQLHHLWLKRTVRIMAVIAFHQSFGNFVMKWLLKRRMDVGVASVA
jgi:hypothetical protein